MATNSNPIYGTCTGCGRQLWVRKKDGLVCVHPVNPKEVHNGQNTCSGSNQAPVVGAQE